MRLFLAVLIAAGSLFAAGDLSGRRAPGFSLPDASSRYHDPQDYRGRIVIVDFMSTSCPHCSTFSKILEKVKAKYAGKVAVLMVVNPPADNQSTVTRYAAAHKITSPILFDCGQVAASYLKVTPQNPSFDIPHFFVIDQQGMIRHNYGYSLLNKGIFEGDGIFPIIDSMLGGAAPAGKKK